MLRTYLLAASLAVSDALSLGCSSTRRPALAPRRARAVRCADDEDGGSLLDGLIPREKNPYLTNKADRMRAELGEASVVGQSFRSGGRDAAEDRLAEDIARFKAERGLSPTVGLDKPGGVNYADVSDEDEEVGMLQNVINTLGNVLTVNFFIIILFFTWFLAGVGAQFGADNFVLINAFRSCWDVLILPLLSTHMALTFLSFGLEKVAASQEA